MDVMRWSTGNAIYPAFVPLHSFKKANSLKDDGEREREKGRGWELSSALHQVNQAD